MAAGADGMHAAPSWLGDVGRPEKSGSSAMGGGAAERFNGIGTSCWMEALVDSLALGRAAVFAAMATLAHGLMDGCASAQSLTDGRVLGVVRLLHQVHWSTIVDGWGGHWQRR